MGNLEGAMVHHIVLATDFLGTERDSLVYLHRFKTG